MIAIFGLTIIQVWINSKNNKIRKDGIENYALKTGWDYSKFSLSLPDNYEKYFQITFNPKQYFYAIMSKNNNGLEISIMDFFYYSNKEKRTCNHTLILLKINNMLICRIFYIFYNQFLR